MARKVTHTAIILAAGLGSRLRPFTNDTPKCLLRVGGRRIIECVVDACEQAGIEDIVVVVGYQANKIKRILGDRVKYIMNNKYDSTNTMYSMWLTRKHCRGRPVVHMNGDTLFDPAMLKELLDHPFPDAMLVDFKGKLDEEATRVVTQGNQLRIVGKDFPVSISTGECLGTRKFSARTASKLYEQIGKSIRRGDKKSFMHSVLNQYVKFNKIECVPTGEHPWIEIDFPHDLERAKEIARRINEKPQVLIFAAGVGRRLYPLTKNKPKALLEVNRKTLIERQIEICRKIGLSDVIVAVGYKEHEVRKLLGRRVKYARNPLYSETNPMYTFWCARHLISGRPLITIDGDMLFDEKILSKIAHSKHENAMMFDSSAKLNDEAAKVVVKNNKIVKLGRNISVDEASGEYLGMAKFSAEGVNTMLELCREILDTETWKKSHLPWTLFSLKMPFYAISSNRLPWIEIDFASDYKKGQKMKFKRGLRR